MGRGVSSLPNDDPERLARIQDAKLRTIGVDKHALDSQVAEKKARQQAEHESSMQYTRLAGYFADQVQLKQQEAALLRKEINEEQEDFRKLHQQKDTRREWDLNDPNALKNEAPARTSDDPAQISVSGLQMFDGEDLSAGDRAKLQMEQCKNWWDQQKAEKECIKAAEHQEEMQYAALLKAQEALQQECVAQEHNLRKELSLSQRDENLRLAQEKHARGLHAKAEDLHMNSQEQYYNATSKLLTEDPVCATSSLSPARFRPDHFKGYSAENAREVREYQRVQVEEKATKKAMEAAEDLAYASYINKVNKALVEQERSAADFRKQQLESAAGYLRRQTTEKQDRDQFLNKTLYTNEPDGVYFKQFGTSHR